MLPPQCQGEGTQAASGPGNTFSSDTSTSTRDSSPKANPCPGLGARSVTHIRCPPQLREHSPSPSLSVFPTAPRGRGFMIPFSNGEMEVPGGCPESEPDGGSRDLKPSSLAPGSCVWGSPQPPPCAGDACFQGRLPGQRPVLAGAQRPRAYEALSHPETGAGWVDYPRCTEEET